jgi:putative transposase
MLYMPSKNIVKEYQPDSFYHVYNRGVNKQNIFTEDTDYQVFLNLLKRHLSAKNSTDRYGRTYKNFSKELELLAFCLQKNHLHLFFYQLTDRSLSNLMQRVMTAYSVYFNKKYHRLGHLFQDRFKASLIDNDAYLWHISRYIHLNPLDMGKDFEDYPYSSYPYYVSAQTSDWIHPERILALHQDHQSNYDEFCHDYEGYKETLDEIKLELA